MEVPSAIYVLCPSCQEETLHRVIKGKLIDKKRLALDSLVKCSSCGHRHQTLISEAKPISIPIIISEGANSTKDTMEMSAEEEIRLDNEYQFGRNTIKITGIETSTGRVESAKARDVGTLWAKKFDRLKLKISINKGSKTWARTVWAVPDEEFFVGDVMRIKGLSVTIHAIKTKNRHIKSGSAEARDIVRLYAKVVR